MVDYLTTAAADINASDNSAKMSLHWAAAVKKVNAVNITDHMDRLPRDVASERVHIV